MVGENKGSWDNCLKFTLWDDCVTKKRATSKSLCDFVYGLDVVFPKNLRLLMYKLLQKFTTNQDALQAHIYHLTQLDEDCRVAYDYFVDYKTPVKKVVDRKVGDKSLWVKNLVLLWDKKNEKPRDHGKFNSLWLGLYLIDASTNPNKFITTLDYRRE